MKAVILATFATLAISASPVFAQSACLQSDGSSLPSESCNADTGTTGSIINQSGTNNTAYLDQGGFSNASTMSQAGAYSTISVTQR